jgi:phosphoribosylformylglycinamidine synthase
VLLPNAGHFEVIAPGTPAGRPSSRVLGERLAWGRSETPVYVTLKPGVLDPAGRAIHHALEGLGFAASRTCASAGDRAGRGRRHDASALEDMARRLLANTVIENYRIELP